MKQKRGGGKSEERLNWKYRIPVGINISNILNIIVISDRHRSIDFNPYFM